jgi:RND family efflux transporter MFP subunit
MKRITQSFRFPAYATLLALATIVMGLTGCGPRNQANDATLPTATVQAQTAEYQPRIATEDAIGTVLPKLKAVIEAKVSGSIEEMLVVPGQSVKAGDLLVQLNASEIQARYDQAEASLKEAEQDWKRTSALYDQQASSRAEYDAADSRYHVALGEAAEAKAMLGYVQIRAPFDGLITGKDADTGDLAVPGKPLVEMEDPGHLRLEANVPEDLAGHVKLGDRLQVSVETIETNLEGTVSEIAPSADPGSGTFVIKLDLPQFPGLRSGQFGRVAVPSGEISALRVPVLAVMQRGDMELVFVVTGGHAQLRIVKTGSRVGEEAEIVSGLDAGEQVVVSNPNNLLDGQPVVLKP